MLTEVGNKRSVQSTLKIWSLLEGQEVPTVVSNQQFTVRSLAFQPSGPLLAIGLAGPSEPNAMSMYLSLGNTTVPVEKTGHDLLIWDQNRNAVTPIEDESRLANALAFSPDGEILAAGSLDPGEFLSTLSLWEPKSGHKIDFLCLPRLALQTISVSEAKTKCSVPTRTEPFGFGRFGHGRS
jgi:WD40 repeat protein